MVKRTRKHPLAPEPAQENLYFVLHRIEKLPGGSYEVVGEGRHLGFKETLPSKYQTLRPQGKMWKLQSAPMVAISLPPVRLFVGDTVSILRDPGHIVALFKNGNHAMGREDAIDGKTVRWERELLLEYVHPAWVLVPRPDIE